MKALADRPNIELTVGIAVDQNPKKLTKQVEKVMAEVGATPTPLKIKIDKNSFKGDISELQAILKNAFRSVGIDLSDLVQTGDTAKFKGFIAQVRSMTDGIAESGSAAQTLGVVLSKTLGKASPGLKEINAQLGEINLGAKKYYTLVDNAETRIRNQTKNYLTAGGANPEVLNKVITAYQRLADIRADLESGKNPGDTFLDPKTGEDVTYGSKFQGWLTDVKMIEAEVKNLNSQLADTARREKEALTPDTTSMVGALRDVQARVDKARGSLVGVGNEIFQQFDSELIRISGNLGTLENGLNSGKISSDAFSEGIEEAKNKIAELNAKIAASKTPNAMVDPTGSLGRDASISLDETISKLIDIQTKFRALTKGTGLRSGVMSGIGFDTEDLNRVWLALESGEITVKELDDALANASKNLAKYRGELSRVSEVKQSGAYSIDGSNGEAETVARLSAKVQNELNKIATASDAIKTTFGGNLKSALGGLREVSEGFQGGSVEASKYTSAIEAARLALAQLDDAQAKAAAPEAYIKKGTSAYENAKNDIEKLISALDALEKKYLSLGKTTTEGFQKGGTSYANLREMATGLLGSLNAGKLTNAGATEGIGSVNDGIKELADYERYLNKIAVIAKKKDQLEKDALAAQRRGTQALKWTAARGNPETAQYYEKIAQAVRSLSAAQREWQNGAKDPAAFDKMSTAVKKSAQDIDLWRSKIEELGADRGGVVSKLGEKFKTLFTYAIGARVIYGAASKVRELISQAVELDSAMGQLRIVTDETESAYRKFGNTAASTAKEIGASMTDIINATTTYARLGYSLDESSILSKYTAMLSQVGDIESSAAQDALTSMIKAFGDAVDASKSEDIEHLMDELVKVGNNFPISVSQIAEGMTNASSALAASGNTIEQSIALLTAANTTVQDISKASTGLRTIAARIRNTSAELEELGEESMTKSKYEELVKTLTDGGVQLRDALTGEYRSTYDIIKDLAAKWDDLSSMEQSAITTALAGKLVPECTVMCI